MAWGKKFKKWCKKAKKKLKKVTIKNVAGKIAGDLDKAAGQISDLPVVGIIAAPAVGALTQMSSSLNSVQKSVDKISASTDNVTGGLKNAIKKLPSGSKSGNDSIIKSVPIPPGFNPPIRYGALSKLGTTKKINRGGV